MEMGFTALRVLLVNNVLIVLFFSSCTQKSVKLNAYHADSIELQNINGLLYTGAVPFTGLLYTLSPKGDSVFSRSYVKGLENGAHKQWYPNAKLYEIRRYSLGKKAGVSIGYWPDGSKRYLYRFVNDLHEGIQYEWYNSGKLYTKKNYKAGYESGLQQSWNPDGSIKSNYESKNGRNYGNIGKKNCYSLWKDSAFVSAY